MIGRRFTTERVRVERRRRFLVMWIIRIVLVLSCLFLLSQLSRLSQLSINRVVIHGITTVSHRDIFNLIAPEFEGSYGYIFSKQNILFIRTHKLEGILTNAYPRFDRVNVSRRDFDVLAVSIREREPFAVWCVNDSKCYFVDTSGFVYAPSPTFLTGGTYIRYGGGLTSLTEPVGSWFLPEEEFKTLNALFDELDTKGIITSRSDVTDTSVTLTVRPSVSSGIGETATFKILLTASSSYTTALNDLSVILNSSDFKTEIPDLAYLEYIDLRYGNKVFYKKKGVISVE
ncbi:MAG: hypothetical protein AAB458_00680 [Patescibacteria group bacterium]